MKEEEISNSGMKYKGEHKVKVNKNTHTYEIKLKKALKTFKVLIDLWDVFVCVLLCVCPEGDHASVVSHASDWKLSQIMSSGHKTCPGSLTCICFICMCVHTNTDSLDRQVAD